MVIGYLSVVKKDTYLYLGDYCVTEDYRGIGIGSNLISMAEDFAFSHDFDEVHLHVQTANFQSREFYSKKGYNFVEKMKKECF